jgi:putative peptidoglycan lipid II flippase
MSRVTGDTRAIGAALGERLRNGLRQMTYFVVPSAVALLALGGEIAGAVYQSGDFARADTLLVWGALAGYATGLIASTQGRLYSSAFYALGDTRTPVRFTFVRIAVSLGLGFPAALWLPEALGLDPVLGVVGLATASGICGWVEYLLLRRAMFRRIGVEVRNRVLPLFGAAVVAAAGAWGAKLALGNLPPLLSALLTLGVFGAIYFGVTAALGVPETALVVDRLRRLAGRRS